MARGFSLVELAISIAIIAVLSVVIIFGVRTFLELGREQRTVREVRGLVVASRDAVMRGFESDVGACGTFTCTTDAPVRRFLGHPISTSGLCYDLSGGTWGGATAVDASIKTAIAGPTAFTGLNTYGQPYGLCVHSRRIDVFTCIPAGEVPNELSTGFACPTTPIDFSSACGGNQCVGATLSLLPKNFGRLAFSYKYQYWGEATTAP